METIVGCLLDHLLVPLPLGKVIELHDIAFIDVVDQLHDLWVLSLIEVHVWSLIGVELGQDNPESEVSPLVVMLKYHWQPASYLEEIEDISIERGILLDNIAEACLISRKEILNVIQ